MGWRRHVISAEWPETRILVLTSFAGVDKIMPAIKAGALGYLLKDSDPEVLVDSIRQVYCGNSSLHPSVARASVARALLQEVARSQDGRAAESSDAGPVGDGEVEALTERETQVLGLIARGWSNQSIADELTVSCATVRTHVSHILAKLNLASRTQAALYALRRGWVSLQDGEPPSFR